MEQVWVGHGCRPYRQTLPVWQVWVPQRRSVRRVDESGVETGGRQGDDSSDAAARFEEAVLTAVERIPPGRVCSYGQLASWVNAPSPRMVGRLLARWGAAVPWWRVVRADGSCAPTVRERQLRLLAAEAVPLRGDRVDLGRCRWDGGTTLSAPTV